MHPPFLDQIFVGCAGWSLSAMQKELFPLSGTHLQRYAQRFRTVEINSSFYRAHKVVTYARWAESVPADFIFTAKLPREITHFLRLRQCEALLEKFLSEIAGLREKLGVLLVQLPPSFGFSVPLTETFFRHFRQMYSGAIAFEPRHASWFNPDAEELLKKFQIGRVAADPAPVPKASEPTPDLDFVYYRLHGSPQMYFSDYPPLYLEVLAESLRNLASKKKRVFCIFDNTAADAAIPNALFLQNLLRNDSESSFAGAFFSRIEDPHLEQ